MRIEHRGREFDVDDIRDELDRWKDHGYECGLKHGAVATALAAALCLLLFILIRSLA